MNAPTETLVILVTGRPVTQGSKTRTRWGMMESNARALQPWRESVKWAALRVKPAEWETVGAFTLYIVFKLPRAASNKRHLPTQARSGDIDKLVRAVMDALTDAGIWENDSQCVTLRALKRFVASDETPGAMLTVVRHDELERVAGTRLAKHPRG